MARSTANIKLFTEDTEESFRVGWFEKLGHAVKFCAGNAHTVPLLQLLLVGCGLGYLSGIGALATGMILLFTVVAWFLSTNISKHADTEVRPANTQRRMRETAACRSAIVLVCHTMRAAGHSLPTQL